MRPSSPWLVEVSTLAEVTLPSLGESVTEGIITQWFKKVGDLVARDESLFEVSTDKVDSEMPSPASGVLTQILAAEGDTVQTGAVVAIIDESATEAVAQPAGSDAAAAPTASTSSTPAPVASSATGASGVVLSPVVRRILADGGVSHRRSLVPAPVGLSPVATPSGPSPSGRPKRSCTHSPTASAAWVPT